LHGGASGSGAPPGERNGQYRHGERHGQISLVKRKGPHRAGNLRRFGAMATMYTLDDLRQAEEQLALLEERGIGSDRHSNPDYGRGAINDARFLARHIRQELMSAGLIPRPPKTDQDLLCEELDKRFPNARSREVVEYNGKRYIRRFTPLRVSRSGKTVMEWHRSWVDVE
jgi:hypothetical protein